MAATHVELIVNHVCAGSVVSDELETVSASGAGSGGNRFASQRCLAHGRTCIEGLRVFADFNFFDDGGKFEREMPKRRGIRHDGEVG